MAHGPGEIRYARAADGVDIAWTEVGREDGPRLLFVPGFVSHLDMNWELSATRQYVEDYMKHCRVLTFDKRGTGLSGRDLGFGSVAERADDIRVVMDAAGWETASFLGISEGGPLSLVFAAQSPERVTRLALYGTGARFAYADDYPIGAADFDADRFVAYLERSWGTGRALAPFFAHTEESHLPQLARFERAACTPSMAATVMRNNLTIDVRYLLATVSVPTLVLHCAGDPIVPVESGRYLADHIPGARFVEVDSPAHGSWRDEDTRAVREAVLEFVSAKPVATDIDRVLATVLFTDIVDSTQRAASAGDRAWRELLDQHDTATGRVVERYGGRLVKQTGDGMLATFDGPARAVKCARELHSALAAVGLPIRAGMHTGEVERRGDDIGGIAVHIASRVAGLAGEGDVLVSRTVRDLVVGSDLTFEDRGTHELKGVPDEWQVYAAV